MDPVPVSWPIGSGPSFVGVYELAARRVLRFERVARGERAAPFAVSGLDDPELRRLVGERLHERLVEEAELLEAAGHRHDPEAIATGRQTPVFFGSALNNFGVAPFLEALGRLGAPPAGRESDAGRIAPESEVFSGFVFKIQANMDPRHGDSMAFLRVVSGRFEKDMSAEHSRLGQRVRLPRAHRIFAQERETTEEAFPGDVVGLVNPGLFAIGDTVSDGAAVRFPPLPRFPPEHFARLRPASTDQAKAFRKGLAQLEEEGVIQVFYEADAVRREPILGAVGELQFDLVQSRLAAEYRVVTALDRLPHLSALWLIGGPGPEGIGWPTRGSLAARDRDGRTVALSEGPWVEELLRERNPDATWARTV